MKTFILLFTFITSAAYAQFNLPPVHNFPYIDLFDYRAEVEDSDRPVVLIISSAACLRGGFVSRSCMLTERRIDQHFVPKIAHRIKTVGVLVDHGIPRLPYHLQVTRFPTVFMMYRGMVLDKVEPVPTPRDPVTHHPVLDLRRGSWEAQFIAEFEQKLAQLLRSF
jgi:hypothetical protein